MRGLATDRVTDNDMNSPKVSRLNVIAYARLGGTHALGCAKQWLIIVITFTTKILAFGPVGFRLQLKGLPNSFDLLPHCFAEALLGFCGPAYEHSHDRVYLGH